MTLKELKRDGNLICEFKKLGFFDGRCGGQLSFYRTGDPTYCAVYVLGGKYYFVHRITSLFIYICFSYEDAMQRVREFVTNAGL